MIQHVWNYPGSRTDEVSEHCAIGNVSDAATNKLSRESQRRLGIVLRCEVEPARNRYGQKTVIGRWWLDIVDYNKLVGAAANHADYDAANDPEYGEDVAVKSSNA
jgi:hypothetical protein